MNMIPEGLISLYSFISALSLPAISVFLVASLFSIPYAYLCPISILISYLIINFCFMLISSNFMQIVSRASFLGSVFCSGLCITILADHTLSIFGWYTCVLSFFHYSEYLTIAITNPKALTTDAFMLNHSPAYKMAAAASWVEFFLEYYFIRELKNHFYISTIGILICITGEILRKLAMFTASTNFNHIVQTVKDKDHILITNGVYSLCRHPSYVGWFYWSIGTQIILVNPVCIIIYTLASWSFFKSRVIVEEETLLNFFGDEYKEYKRKVPTGIPFNKGIALDK